MRKKRSSKMIMNKRNGIVLIVLLAVLIFVVNIVTMSYSWFSPTTKSSNGMAYDYSGGFRSENCTIRTFFGLSDNGALTFNDEIDTKTVSVGPSSSYYEGMSSALTTNGIQYFQTVVYNYSAYDTNVSLYISSVPEAAPSEGNSFGLGVMSPTNSYHVFDDVQSDLNIIRNAHIARGEDSDDDGTIDKPGELIVEWFIKPDGAAVSVNIQKLYILYN